MIISSLNLRKLGMENSLRTGTWTIYRWFMTIHILKNMGDFPYCSCVKFITGIPWYLGNGVAQLPDQIPNVWTGFLPSFPISVWEIRWFFAANFDSMVLWWVWWLWSSAEGWISNLYFWQIFLYFCCNTRLPSPKNHQTLTIIQAVRGKSSSNWVEVIFQCRSSQNNGPARTPWGFSWFSGMNVISILSKMVFQSILMLIVYI